MNLLKNAIKFTHEGTVQIVLNYDKHLEILNLQVIDSGEGIARESISSLFTRFGKLTRSATTNHNGIGLGLMIVKQIAESHGGTVCVDSEGKGTGSCFTVTLKMTPQAKKADISTKAQDKK